MARHVVILSASMGAGHDAVAAELARRLAERGDRVEVVDVLRLLPLGLGRGLRGCYALMIGRAPWLYELVYRAFFVPRGRLRGGTGPVVAPLAHALRRRWERRPPDEVVSVFHLAAQACGRLRREGFLAGPSAVFVTDFAAHRQWVHAGNDLHLCLTGDVAAAVRRLGGREAVVVGPIVAPAFRSAADDAPRPRAAGSPRVLLSGGGWGAGSRLTRTARALAAGGYTAVVLCGRDERLRRRVAAIPGTVALGWVADMPRLLAGVRALVDNAAGQTAVQALAAGVPVVVHRPIPGHGADGARHMARAGVADLARDDADLLALLDAVTAEGQARAARTRTGRALFTADAAAVLAAVRPRGR